MNGPVVVAIALLGTACLFVAIVWADTVMDRRERRRMYAESLRYERAVQRLTALHRQNPGYVRLGHEEAHDDVR